MHKLTRCFELTASEVAVVEWLPKLLSSKRLEKVGVRFSALGQGHVIIPVPFLNKHIASIALPIIFIFCQSLS